LYLTSPPREYPHIPDIFSSVVVKDLRLKDKDKDLMSKDEDKDLASKDEDKDEDLSFKDKDLGRQ